MSNEALELKKEKKANKYDKIVTTDQGVRIRIHPVSPLLFNDVKRKIKKPKPPEFENKDTGRVEENTSHPDYIEAMEDYTERIGAAVLDAAAVFGIELIDPLPENNKWLSKIKLMIKQGLIDGVYDMEDPDELEFLYIRYFAVGTDELTAAMQGPVPEEAVEQQRDSFPSNEIGNSNTSSIAEL